MTMDPKFPLELGDLILDCLDCNDDGVTLRNCALVSRGWARSSQRNLFRNMKLPLPYEDMTRLRTCLEGSPHLATYSRCITFGQGCMSRSQEIARMDAYMTCLDALLSLFSRATSVEVTLIRERWSDALLERFLARLHVFICASPVVELTVDTCYLDTVLPALDGLLIGSRIRRLTVLEWESWDADQPSPPTVIAPLSSLEVIRLGTSGYQDRDILDWLNHQQERLPKLKCCEILVTGTYDVRRWGGNSNEFRNPFESLRLETFRFEFSSDFLESYPGGWGRYPLILKGLHFRHILFTIHVPPRPRTALSVDLVRHITEWWTKTLNTLSDSKASVCFTELTFTAHLLAVSEVMEAWHALDMALCHEAFRGMRSVYFENLKGCRITEGDYPTDAALIQLALPGLAGRGLLSL
ncbi:hypothetical protein BDZ89DRAFT_1059950 [Hymenopellis radicata]|nr:hypothetical protein BDZ89DRAFT_1059950 [Hymenopellis radicata]